VKKYKANVFGFAKYLLSDADEAEDAAQEVMIKLWNNFSTINPAAYKSWIMKTTYNLCIDYRRKRKIIKLKDFNEDGDIDLFADIEADSPLEIKENNDLRDVISSRIDKLPETQRSVFVLYEIEGMKYKEIAKILEVPLNSVKVNLLRARKKLQILLKDVYEGRQAV